MTLKTDIDNLMKKFGVEETGNIKKNVDALTARTKIPVGTPVDTVTTLNGIGAWADDGVPKMLEASGLETTGELLSDLKALRDAWGVGEMGLARELHLLSNALDIKSDKKPDFVNKDGFLVQSVAAKQVEAPCVCTTGMEQCRHCRAEKHPCVCILVLITEFNSPLNFCRAEVHECACQHSCYSHGTRIKGLPDKCRQHNDADGRAKKKVKKERG